jgi:hypothetical protein
MQGLTDKEYSKICITSPSLPEHRGRFTRFGPLNYGVRGDRMGREDPASNRHGACRCVENL